MFFKKDKKQQARQHEAKGEVLFQSKAYAKALAEFKKSQALDPYSISIYQKLIETHDLIKEEWQEEDFSLSMDWLLKKQELEHPILKLVHQRFSPEYTAIEKLLQELLASEAAQESKIIEKILNHGEQALYPLLAFVLRMKVAAEAEARDPIPPPLPSDLEDEL